jgi:hypothetical protein
MDQKSPKLKVAWQLRKLCLCQKIITQGVIVLLTATVCIPGQDIRHFDSLPITIVCLSQIYNQSSWKFHTRLWDKGYF